MKQYKLRQPTERQLAFVKLIVEGVKPYEAYHMVGYWPLYDTTSKSRRDIKISRIVNSRVVQALLKTAREEVLKTYDLGMDKIIEGFMLAHSHARTVKEELSALREIAKLLGYYDRGKIKAINNQVKGKELSELTQSELERLIKADELEDLMDAPGYDCKNLPGFTAYDLDFSENKRAQDAAMYDIRHDERVSSYQVLDEVVDEVEDPTELEDSADFEEPADFEDFEEPAILDDPGILENSVTLEEEDFEVL